MAPPRRRQSDRKRLSDWIISAAKASFSFIALGIIAFIGSWGVETSKSIAQLKQDVAVVHEKQEFIGPWLVEEVRRARDDMKEIQQELKQLNRRK